MEEFSAGRVELKPGGGSCGGKADAVEEADEASCCCW